MPCYLLRSKEGVSKARFSAESAQKIMNEAPGYFRKANYPDRTVTVFEYTGEGSIFGLTSVVGFELFLWNGDILVPETF